MADPKKINYADLESLAGKEVGVSDWHQIDQDRVNMFADATRRKQSALHKYGACRLKIAHAPSL